MTCNRQSSCSLGLSTFNKNHKNHLTFHFHLFKQFAILKAYFFLFCVEISFDAIYFSFSVEVSLVQCPPPPPPLRSVRLRSKLQAVIAQLDRHGWGCAERLRRTSFQHCIPLLPPPPTVTTPHMPCNCIAK
jgi:hypothetical protein